VLGTTPTPTEQFPMPTDDNRVLPPKGSLLLIALLAVLLGACGGGGGSGGDDSSDPPDDSGNPPPDSGSPPPDDPNGDLSGKLYFDSPEDYVGVDLVTTERTVVRGDDAFASASADGGRFVTTAEPLDDDAEGQDLLVLDKDGVAVSRLHFDDFVGGRPRLSPDGQYVAFGYDYANDLVVYDLDGRPVAELLEDASDWAWTPDGRLVATKGDAIWISDTGLSAMDRLQRFSDDTPRFISVSPDGSQLAFTLGDLGTLDNHVHVMPIDGGDARQLTTSPINEDGPAWSPDGQWIIVRQGISYEGAASNTPDDCPRLWAVPADAIAAELADGESGAQLRLSEYEDGNLRAICAFSTPDWREPESLATADGSAPTANGSDTGLAGHLYFDGFDEGGDAGFIDYTIDTRARARLPLPAGLDPSDAFGLYVDEAAGEMAFVQTEPDSGNGEFQQITLQTLAGEPTARFEQYDYFSGQPKISPDGDLIAVEWHASEAGDPGGIPVVTIFDRSGSIVQRWSHGDGWDWLPNGKLALSAVNQVFVTNKALDAADPIETLGDDISGLVASPDGERFAFAMAGHVWTMNADGSQLTRMTRARDAVRSPAWSPDGHYLAVVLEASCAEIHVIPSDGKRVSVGDPLIDGSSVALTTGDDGALCTNGALNWR